jgi:excisionase family DNA binding protein
MTIHQENRLLLLPREAAKALAISERTLWTLTKAGEIPCVRLGSSKRYNLHDLEEYIRRRTEVAGRPMVPERLESLGSPEGDIRDAGRS